VPDPASGLDPASEKVIASMAEVWGSLAESCQDLDPSAWELPTDCPGWSVRDQVSHLIGIERTLLGDRAPDAVSPVPAHVNNAMGELNEAWVAERRSVRGPEVLAEFVMVTDRRLEALRAMSNRDFDVVGWSPIGDVPYRDFMVLRVFDSWIHEQDIRRAVGRPGGRGGLGEVIALARMDQLMPYIVGRQVKPREGTTVVLRIGEPLPQSTAIAMGAKRAESLVEMPARPTVVIGLDGADYWRLGCGRISPEEALRSASVSLEGDEALGRQVIGAMNVMI
jgi:uncharacterized protein (TIGR03083 family)